MWALCSICIFQVITKAELIKLVVGLVEVSDADLLDNNALLTSDVCFSKDRDNIRVIRDLVVDLYNNFDFTVSPKFISMVDGKSSAYTSALKRKFNQPVLRSKLWNEYGMVLANVQESNQVYELTDIRYHPKLDEIHEILKHTGNPTGLSAT